MLNIADPLTHWAFATLISVVIGTCLLIAVAFLRRWQQVRYAHYVHTLRRKYRPVVAKVLAGARDHADIEALRELPSADLELLLEPLFSKRKLSERQLVFLQGLCAELEMIALWQGRLASGHTAAGLPPAKVAPESSSGRAVTRYLLRAKSIRNLGKLRHRPSWPRVLAALDDRHLDIQLVALRSLAAMGVPESFAVLRERLHAAVQGEPTPLPWMTLLCALASFDVSCAPALSPSLCHPHPQIRLHAIEILRTMACREAARQAGFTLTAELLTPTMVEWLLGGLAVDASAEIRAGAAEVLVFLPDPRVVAVLRSLLRDPQWIVRQRTARALAQVGQAAAPLRLEIRDCLYDPHWRVREAAIRTLIALGPEGRHLLYEHFLTFPSSPTREQIVEVMELTGLMSTLVEDYSKGTDGLAALIIEQVASDAAALGLSGVLSTVNPETRQKFLDRFLPHARAKMRFMEEVQPQVESDTGLQLDLDIAFSPHLAA